MNVKRFLLAVIVLAVVGYLYDWVVHGILLRSIYEQFPELWRTPEPTVSMILTGVAWAIIFCLLYAQYGKARPWGASNGLWFGLWTGLLAGWLPVVYNKLVLANFPAPVYLAWAGGGTVGYILLGALLGAVYRE